MAQGSWPLDPVAAAALVVRAIDDILGRSEDEAATLLAALMCAAWGNALAQNQ
jgi:hypothetical protein